MATSPQQPPSHKFSIVQPVFPGQLLCLSSNPQPERRSRQGPAPRQQNTAQSRGSPPGARVPRTGRECCRSKVLGTLPAEGPVRPRHPAGSWKVLPATDSVLDPPLAPDIPDSHMSFLREMPASGRAASGRQPPQGQFQGRNCFGLGLGSENKHSGFYRFTRVGCCFPFQQLLNRAFHSEAGGL